MSPPPGPDSPDPFSPFFPPRTPGSLGNNDAADPSVNAYPGITPSSLGVNDGAAYQAGILQIRNVAAVAQSVKIIVPRHLKIGLPKTKEKVEFHSREVTAGGRFMIHADIDKSGKPIEKAPDVKVTLTKTAHIYEIKSIEIYTLKIVRNPASMALPVVGKNVTNDKTLGVRKPAGSPDGKGYWKDVIKNMESYQYSGDPKKAKSNLQWYAAGSSKYHEEVHNQQFRSWMKKENDSTLQKILKKLGNLQLKASNALQAKDEVAKAVRWELVNLIHSQSGLGTDENEAYRKTYQKIWMPVIQKIKADAKNAGWV